MTNFIEIKLGTSLEHENTDYIIAIEPGKFSGVKIMVADYSEKCGCSIHYCDDDYTTFIGRLLDFSNIDIRRKKRNEL